MSSLASVSDACIDACLRCARICWQTATQHCLTEGGKHVEPEHYRLMLQCAAICRLCADFQLSSSIFSEAVRKLCADVCEACALSCEGIGDMDDCVSACRICAASCEEMSNPDNSNIWNKCASRQKCNFCDKNSSERNTSYKEKCKASQTFN